MNKCELVNSGATERTFRTITVHEISCANEQVNSRRSEHKSSGHADPWPEQKFSNSAFGVPLSIPGQEITTPVVDESPVYHRDVDTHPPLITWPVFSGSRSVHPPYPVPLTTVQAPSKQGFRAIQMDKDALNKSAEVEGERIDTTECLNSQYKHGYRLLFSDELRSSGLMSRAVEDQRPLYNYAVDERIDDMTFRSVRAIRAREVDRCALARRTAGHRIILNACAVPVDHREPLSSPRKTSERENRSLKNSGVRRYTKWSLLNWTADHYNPNDHA